MRLGLALPHYDFSFPDGGSVTPERVTAVARRAEELGFDSVWISDHFFLSLARYGGEDRRFGSLEPMTTLSAVATVTSRVRLGTLVLGAPFRPPALLAKEAVSVDLLSGGRLDLGIGAGWYEEEFEASGYRFGTVGERFRTLETVLEEIQPLFRTSAPAPAQAGGPPILLGGKGGPRLLRLAARLAAGWNTGWAWTPDAYAGRVAEARRSCEEIGRDPSTFRLSLGLYTIVGEDEKDARARFDRMRGWPHGAAMLEGKTMQAYSADTLTGTCEQVLDRLASFAELGVDEVIVAPAPLPFALPQPEMLEILGARVIPALRSL